MSGWRENISVRLLDAALDPERGRYRRDNQWDRETELDFQNRQIRERAALAALTAQIEELLARLERAERGRVKAWNRAEAAEQRVKELEAALRECIDWIDRPGYTEGDAATSSMARAALVQSDPPED